MPGLWLAMLALVQQPLPRPAADVAAVICRAGASDALALKPQDQACPPCLSCVAVSLAFAAVPSALAVPSLGAGAAAMRSADHSRSPPLFKPDPPEPNFNRN